MAAVGIGTTEDFAAVIFSEGGRWQVEVLPERLTGNLDALLHTLRQQPSDRGVIGLVDLGDDFFVAIRLAAGRERIVLSDVTAAVASDLARQVCARLEVEVPGEADLEEVWPAGDLGLFEDLGMDEMEMGALLADTDAYADEQLLALARRLGFGSLFESLIETASL